MPAPSVHPRRSSAYYSAKAVEARDGNVNATSNPKVAGSNPAGRTGLPPSRTAPVGLRVVRVRLPCTAASTSGWTDGKAAQLLHPDPPSPRLRGRIAGRYSTRRPQPPSIEKDDLRDPMVNHRFRAVRLHAHDRSVPACDVQRYANRLNRPFRLPTLSNARRSFCDPWVPGRITRVVFLQRRAGRKSVHYVRLPADFVLGIQHILSMPDPLERVQDQLCHSLDPLTT